RHAPGPARSPRRPRSAHRAARRAALPRTRRLLESRHRHRRDRPRRPHHLGRNHSMTDASAPSATSAEEIAQTTPYTSYTAFRSPEDGELSLEQIRTVLEEVLALIDADGVELLGFYDVSGFRAEADLMLWLAADEPAALQTALREFERSAAGTWLHREWAGVG